MESCLVNPIRERENEREGYPWSPKPSTTTHTHKERKKYKVRHTSSKELTNRERSRHKDASGKAGGPPQGAHLTKPVQSRAGAHRSQSSTATSGSQTADAPRLTTFRMTVHRHAKPQRPVHEEYAFVLPNARALGLAQRLRLAARSHTDEAARRLAPHPALVRSARDRSRWGLEAVAVPRAVLWYVHPPSERAVLRLIRTRQPRRG